MSKQTIRDLRKYNNEFRILMIKNMQLIRGCLFAAIFLTVSSSDEVMSENIMLSNFPYERELEDEIQLGKILMIPQRLCPSKRNSEIINSLLGLPKNINNAGK